MHLDRPILDRLVPGRSSVLAALVAVALFCLQACQSSEGGNNPSGSGDGSGGGEVTQDPSGGGSTEAQDPGQGILSQEADAQRNALLVEQYRQAADGKRLLGDESSLREARGLLLKALDRIEADSSGGLENQRAAIQAELTMIRQQLGLETDAQTYGEEMELRAELSAEQKRNEVRSLLDTGNVSLRETNYREALEDSRRARNIMTAAPLTDFADLPGQVQALEQAAQAGLDREQEADLAAMQAQAQQELRAEQQRQASELRSKVDNLLTQAAKAFELRRFEDARMLSRRALDDDPVNEVARQLYDASIKAAREKRNDDYYQRMALEVRRMQEAAIELRIPQQDILYVDDVARERAANREVKKVARATVDQDDQDLMDRVNTETLTGLTFNEDNGEYRDVKTRITAITRIPIIITPAAIEVIDGEGLLLTMTLNAPITVANFLDQMVKKSEDLAWVIESGVVQITSRAESGGNNYLDQKDVRDLVAPRTVFLPPTISGIPSGDDTGEVSRTGSEGDEQTYFVELDTLIDSLKSATDPNYWEAEGGGVIEQVDGGYLLVNANQKYHDAVDRVLNDLRRFATSVVTIESKFLQISRNFLQEIGVDFRGLGGSGAKGTVAQLDDITNGLDDNASRGLDNSGTSDPAGNPASGAFFNDGADGDIRGRTENFFTDPLGEALSTTGGATAAIVFLDDLEIQAIIQAVEKREDVQEVNGQNLTVLNNERGHVSIINQTAYVRDFDVEVAQAAFIADPKIDVIQDGVVLDVKPTISSDRRKITLEMQPTIAELIRPIPTFSTSLAGATQPVTVQLPQLVVRSFATTVTVPDGGSVLIGGLREVLSRERRASVPIFGELPLLGFFFKQEGVVDENTSLMVLVRANVTDVKDYMEGR